MRILLLLCAITFSAAANASSYPADSLYHLDATFTNQAGAPHALDVHRGHPVLITMFYGSCPTTCPLLIETVRAVERALPEAKRNDLRVLLVSVDHENDTPAALAKLAHERRIDTSRWTLAHADARSVRKLAALLNIQYRKLPDGGYNHSSILTVLGPTGAIEAQSSVIGSLDPKIVAAITQAATTP